MYDTARQGKLTPNRIGRFLNDMKKATKLPAYYPSFVPVRITFEKVVGSDLPVSVACEVIVYKRARHAVVEAKNGTIRAFPLEKKYLRALPKFQREALTIAEEYTRVVRKTEWITFPGILGEPSNFPNKPMPKPRKARPSKLGKDGASPF